MPEGQPARAWQPVLAWLLQPTGAGGALAILLAFTLLIAGFRVWPVGALNLVTAATLAAVACGLLLLRRGVDRATFYGGEEPATWGVPRAVWSVAAVAASVWVLLALPPTFRALDSIRAVQVFWHDEGITLQQVTAFVQDPHAQLSFFRLLQGWITFLPVALVAKVLHAFVPVDVATVNMLMRLYYLAVIWGCVYFSTVLAYMLLGGVCAALLVVSFVFWRIDMYILLAIDRPDGFQLLFMTLSLIHMTLLVRSGRRRSLLWAALFAGMAFGAKFSGHLLLPALLVAAVCQRRPQSEPARLAAGELLRRVLFAGSVVGLAFPLGFFAAAPAHLALFWPALAEIARYLPVYASGNIYNDPHYVPDANSVLWWRQVAARGALEIGALVAAVGGALLAVASAVAMALAPARRRGDLAPLVVAVWWMTYLGFMVSRYGGHLVDYRYVIPVLLATAVLALHPLAAVAGYWRLPHAAREALAAMVALAMWPLLAAQAAHGLSYLAEFRSTARPEFAVGRFLDARVPRDADPAILMTNLAYVPDRFSRLTIANVSVTLDYIEHGRFDYVLVSDNMYEIYAGKAPSVTNPIDPNYQVAYNDVVAAYTAFAGRTHPAYAFVTRIGNWEIFERRNH